MIQTTNKPLSFFAKIVFWFVAINALAGAGSLLLFPGQTDTLFFWEIKPPLTASLFGALYLSGALVVGYLSYRGEWEPARYLVPVLVSAGVLISLATFLHLGLFTPGFRLAYWLVVYVGAPLLALAIYFQQERGGANWTVTEPTTPLTRRVAVIVGVILVAAGLIILAWPQAVIPFWPWTIGPLMVRIFAAWFSAFGFGLLWFLYERDWRRLRHIANLMIVAAGLDLLMVFIHRSDLTSTGGSLWMYCFHLVLIGLLGLLMHWWQWRAVDRQMSVNMMAHNDP